MCDIYAYILHDGTEELVLEHVDLVEAEDGAVRLSNIFGEQKTVVARLKSFSLRDNKILLSDQL